MMRICIGLGVGLLLSATIAMAQPAGPPPGGPASGPYNGGPPGPPGPGAPPGPGGGGHGPGFGPPMMGPPPPPPSKGAVFRLGDGSRRIFIKCADDDSTKLCMDAIGPLLNKLLESK